MAKSVQEHGEKDLKAQNTTIWCKYKFSTVLKRN